MHRLCFISKQCKFLGLYLIRTDFGIFNFLKNLTYKKGLWLVHEVVLYVTLPGNANDLLLTSY